MLTAEAFSSCEAEERGKDLAFNFHSLKFLGSFLGGFSSMSWKKIYLLHHFFAHCGDPSKFFQCK